MVPMMYPQGNHGMKYPSFVAIHHDDGSVSVSHGGVECGQGINTKASRPIWKTILHLQSELAS